MFSKLFSGGGGGSVLMIHSVVIRRCSSRPPCRITCTLKDFHRVNVCMFAVFIKSVYWRSWLIALFPGRNTATPRLQQEHYSVNMSLFVNADQTFSCQKRHRFSTVTHVWLQLPEETLLTCSVSLDWLGFWCNSAPISWWGIRVCTEWSDLMALGGLRSGSLFLFYGLSRAAGSTSSRRTLIIASHLLGHWLLAAFGNGILHIMSPKYPYQSWMGWWTLCS